MREVLPTHLQLASGARVDWSSVRRILLQGTRVPRQVVSPGDVVSVLPGGTLSLRVGLARGEFLDARHGDVLLGDLNLPLAEKADVRLNGEPVKLDRLPRSRAALARFDPDTGRVGRLEVVDPSLGGGGDLWAVRAGLQSGAERPSRPLRAGETLHFELRAPAGGAARFDVAGVAWSLPAREVRPGVYRSTFLVPRGLDARGTFVLGRYSRAGVARPVRVGPAVSLATSPPEVLQVGPEGCATAGAPVFARYQSRGATVDAARVRLHLDGVDVTRLARRTVALVYLQPGSPLAPGTHRARLQVADTAGNRTERSWSFVVPAP